MSDNNNCNLDSLDLEFRFEYDGVAILVEYHFYYNSSRKTYRSIKVYSKNLGELDHCDPAHVFILNRFMKTDVFINLENELAKGSIPIITIDEEDGED